MLVLNLLPSYRNPKVKYPTSALCFLCFIVISMMTYLLATCPFKGFYWFYWRFLSTTWGNEESKTLCCKLTYFIFNFPKKQNIFLHFNYKYIIDVFLICKYDIMTNYCDILTNFFRKGRNQNTHKITDFHIGCSGLISKVPLSHILRLAGGFSVFWSINYSPE